MLPQDNTPLPQLRDPNVPCGIGCTECCRGRFDISQADAARLRDGLQALHPARATAIIERATTWLTLDDPDDEFCPVLDRATGACELYGHRPLTCRNFGPPVRGADGTVALCEKCYPNATVEEIAAVAVDIGACDSSPCAGTVAEALTQPPTLP